MSQNTKIFLGAHQLFFNLNHKLFTNQQNEVVQRMDIKHKISDIGCWKPWFIDK